MKEAIKKYFETRRRIRDVEREGRRRCTYCGRFVRNRYYTQKEATPYAKHVSIKIDNECPHSSTDKSIGFLILRSRFDSWWGFMSKTNTLTSHHGESANSRADKMSGMTEFCKEYFKKGTRAGGKRAYKHFFNRKRRMFLKNPLFFGKI